MLRGVGIRLRSFGGFATAIVVLIALPTCLVFAQTSTATILGVVKDTTGALIPGASITVKHTETGQTRTAISSETGDYNVPLLPVGAYEITTTMPGFKQQVRSGIDLVVGQQAVINLTLEVGAAAEQVTVTEEAPLVNTTLSSTSGLISQQQIKELPLNGRSFDQLLALNAGVVNNTSNMAGGAGGAFPAFSVAGHRQETNRFLLNGVDWVGGNATGQFITPSGASSQLLGVEAVREYNVLEHTYGAEYGKRAGGQVSIVTSSGTNDWHGSLFEYHRNSALDAKNYFEATKGPFKRHQFGGTIGGPLKKDKLFVFGNYEGFQQRLAQSTRTVYPDVQSRQGLLPCYLATPSACPPTADPAARAAFVPVPNLQRGMLPFANTFWPVPNGSEVYSNGLPTGTAYNYNNGVQKIYENFVMTRMDYVMSAKDSLFANYTFSDGERDQPQPDTYYTMYVPLRNQTFGLQETHVFSPTVVNSATLGWVRPFGASVTKPNGTGPAIPASLVYLAGGNPGAIVIGGGTTAASLTSQTPVPGNNPLFGIREYYSLGDDLRFTKGKHSFSAGVWVQRIHENHFGSAAFSAGSAAYSSMLTFLQDIPSQFNIVRNPATVGYRSTEGAWYFQDEMKLRSNLTLRLGLRHEMTDGWNEVADRCSNYVFDKNFVMSTEPRIGHSCLTENHAKLLLQPRVGLAWDPTGKGTWAVRAGFGIHNDLQDNVGNRAYANPPSNAREQLAGPLLSLIPLQKNVPLPRTCGTPGAPPPPACGIYSPGGFDPVMFTPTSQQWSFTIERGIARDLMLSVGYVGSESYHTPLSLNTNAAYPQVCENPQGCISGGTTTNGDPVPVGRRVLVSKGTLYHPPASRPNPYVGSGVQWIDQGTSSYHAMDVSLTKRISRGFAFKANYTWGKAMDLNSAILTPSAGNEPPYIPSPYYRRELNRGVASYNLNHQFNGYTSYLLPFGNGQRFGSGATGVVDKLIGGWQWNSSLRIAGGFPFTPLTGSNTSGTGDPSNSDIPNWNPNFKGKVIVGKPDQWFDPRAFVLPLQGTFGNVSRGALRGPRLFMLDSSLLKRVRISEGLNLQFRAEAFNVLNHPNLSYPNEVVFQGAEYSPLGGVITATATTSRQIQFALKLLF